MDPTDFPGASNTTGDPSSSQNPPNLLDSAIIVDAPREMSSTTPQPTSSKSSSPATTPQEQPEQPEPRHCWICLQDEGVDSPATSEWRSPCPCNLQAHEECLLEWISDIQSPSNTGRRGLSQKILCPQCKAEIKVERPIELIVAVVDLVTAIGRQLLLPSGACMLGGILYSGSMVYGFNAIELVFGADDARRLLFSGLPRPSSIVHEVYPESLVKIIRYCGKLGRLANPFVPVGGDSWLFFMSPFIAPALLLSRTSVADRLFSFLPILYLLNPANHILPTYPPTPGLVLASLPYVRSLYNEAYRVVFADLEKSWLLAVQRKPREGETAEEVAQGEQARANAEDNILGIEVEIINVEEGEAEEPQERADQPQEMPQPDADNMQAGDNQQLNIPPQEGAAPQPDQPQQQDQAQPAQPAQGANEPWEFRRNISTFAIARTIISTLFFPAASSLLGDLLYRTLPTSWVTKPGAVSLLRRNGVGVQPTGLLQEKWGRSIVGGAALVVLKDAVGLYVMWRRAKNQGRRRVVDYERKGGRKRQTQAQAQGQETR